MLCVNYFGLLSDQVEQKAKQNKLDSWGHQMLLFKWWTGLDKIEFLQSHENMDIYQKAFDIIEHYFGSEDEDARVAPSQQPEQFQFATDQSVPMGGFNF